MLNKRIYDVCRVRQEYRLSCNGCVEKIKCNVWKKQEGTSQKPADYYIEENPTKIIKRK